MFDEHNIAGLRSSIWGNIYRAFNVLDERLQPALFSLEAADYFSKEVTVCLRDKNDRENSASFTEGVMTLAEAFRRFSGIENETPILTCLDNFVGQLNDLQGQSRYIFCCHQPSQRINLNYWLVLRIHRSAWTRYGISPDSVYVVSRDASTLLQSLSKFALLQLNDDLSQTLPPNGFAYLTEDEILVRAAGLLLLDVAKARGLDSLLLNYLYHNIDRISALGYERRESTGLLLLDTKDRCKRRQQIQFVTPVPLGRHRAARKVIEMSGDSRAALTDGRSIFGIGPREASADPVEGSVEIRLIGHHKWSAHCNGSHLFTVLDGYPRLPRRRLERENFERDFNMWRYAPESEVERLWQVAEAAAEAAHGALIIISVNAEAEAARLDIQGTRIHPAYISPEVLPGVFSIDGAVLLDPTALCYAVGVILDGSATSEGDSARGSRYNSAVRYVKGSEGRAMALVFSEDGQIDTVLPF